MKTEDLKSNKKKHHLIQKLQTRVETQTQIKTFLLEMFSTSIHIGKPRHYLQENVRFQEYNDNLFV